jgi:hypothetical protein
LALVSFVTLGLLGCNAAPAMTVSPPGAAPATPDRGSEPDVLDSILLEPEVVTAAPDVCASVSCAGVQAATRNPNGGWFETEAVCCDLTRTLTTGCTPGECAPPLCSQQAPHGWCPAPKWCDAGECKPAACGPFFLAGACDDPHAACVFGSCRRTQCDAQADPAGYCAPLACDTASGFCKRPACSPDALDGACSGGYGCCDDARSAELGCALGTCVVLPCSVDNMLGPCPTGQVCNKGVCMPPPCPGANCDPTCGGCPEGLVCDLDGVCTFDGGPGGCAGDMRADPLTGICVHRP